MASSFSLEPDFSETDSNAVSAALEFDVKKSSSAGESCVDVGGCVCRWGRVVGMAIV